MTAKDTGWRKSVFRRAIRVVAGSDTPSKVLEAYEAQLLMAAGDVSRVRAAPMWRRVQRAEVNRKTLPPLAFQEKPVHTVVDGSSSDFGAGRSAGRHPLYTRTDRAHPARKPPHAIDQAL